MNRNEFIKAVSEKAELTQKDTTKGVAAAMKVISDTLANGESVVITGFGVFNVINRKERQGINPKTKEKITIPACKQIRFKPYSELRAALKDK